ncbi:putative membrane-bound dehydrogenase domain-containing protein [Prosthecobacter debontii]|uniref:Putative membrane-bound dehydrogenase domain-containing protein n=1 Tax=Prosthecobacter debontii TaxID=48467 RepID=A0A1T4YKG4_9BACT|nr:PVC-type heme-binding CxxCH protein [Prosthecobacter debontii]SKB02246.1 putative membrane-bound dehydrogenase domain-containing protein [Prosthecobacter debontii]
MRPLNPLFALALLSAGFDVGVAADLPPDPGNTVPTSAARPVVIERSGAEKSAPEHTLPEGWTLQQVASSPLVTHPIMGCVDDQGRLYIGDAVGVNWNQAQLDQNPPNRILLLEDEDGDGAFDRSTVFADKMTFPQGVAWLKGSLYVCSPPGLWKLTDTNGDGVADERQMIVRGFDYTGNAADVHGPKLHPNGRLYWCHGRKGHKVIGKEGHVVHEGKASGIWSCLPDGSDVQWHSLGCADNPTGLAFTPQGDILGTCNLYYSQPRGDTLMHWLLGGVYERADQMQVIAELPRTLSRMPVVHNFGHVAVSGCTLVPEETASALYVTHFNTQRLVRMDLVPSGATFKAVENEFLKIHNPDVHLTDVMVDHDGSLLVLNTGGWFRIGCPSSLMAKPDLLGSVYRLRGPKVTPAIQPLAWKADWQLTSPAEIVQQLTSPEPRAVLHALAAAARQGSSSEIDAGLREMLDHPLEPVLEHALLHAVRVSGAVIGVQDLVETRSPVALRRLLVGFQPQDDVEAQQKRDLAAQHLDDADVALAQVALEVIAAEPEAAAPVTARVEAWLRADSMPETQLKALEGYLNALHAQLGVQALLGLALSHPQAAVREVALRVLADQPGVPVASEWTTSLEPKAGQPQLPLILAVLKRLKQHPFEVQLQDIADNSSLALSVRLKALDARKQNRLTPETLAFLLQTLTDMAAPSAARIQAASMLGAASVTPELIQGLAPALATAGPVELEKLLPLVRRVKSEEDARLLAQKLALNPALLSQQESFYRTCFSHLPPAIFEGIVLPARQKLEQQMDEKKRQLGSLAEKVGQSGHAEDGQKNFAMGKGTCIACHKIGETGRAIGPDLSHIGSIRTERDLLESILFPSNTLARDYEAHVFELSDGQSAMGVIRSHAAEGLIILDVAGQERLLPHEQIVSDTALTTSLMPMGLDMTLTPQELLDLVAYLRSLK